jgi:hypothetical protein
MAAMDSAVSGMSVVSQKEGIEPCISDARHCIGVYQRRRRPLGRLHNRIGEDAVLVVGTGACRRQAWPTHT